jgi:hypothetical protein
LKIINNRKGFGFSGPVLSNLLVAADEMDSNKARIGPSHSSLAMLPPLSFGQFHSQELLPDLAV